MSSVASLVSLTADQLPTVQMSLPGQISKHIQYQMFSFVYARELIETIYDTSHDTE